MKIERYNIYEIEDRGDFMLCDISDDLVVLHSIDENDDFSICIKSSGFYSKIEAGEIRYKTTALAGHGIMYLENKINLQN